VFPHGECAERTIVRHVRIEELPEQSLMGPAFSILQGN
jgi:hypothetical protein